MEDKKILEQHSPYVLAELSTEETINNGIRRWVKWCEALNESGNRYIGLGIRYVTVDLKKRKYDVRTPAEHEDWKKKQAKRIVVSLHMRR